MLALESSLFLGYRGDQQAGTDEPRSTLLGSTIGVWHTQEMLPLFEFVRDTRATKKPLRLAGFDIQPIGSGKQHRPAFFERIVALIDAKYAAEVLAFDRKFVEEYDKG